MRTFPILTIALLAGSIALLGGCGQAQQADAAGTRDVSALRPASLDPDTAKVAVDVLLRDPGNFDGDIALDGVVVQAFADRGAFVMVDLEEFKSCGLEACTDATFPVRVPSDDFEGTVPQPGDFVTVLGAYRALERGFEFDVREVHYEDAVILARK